MEFSGVAAVIKLDAFQRVKLPDYIRGSKPQREGTAFYCMKDQNFYENKILKCVQYLSGL